MKSYCSGFWWEKDLGLHALSDYQGHINWLLDDEHEDIYEDYSDPEQMDAMINAFNSGMVRIRHYSSGWNLQGKYLYNRKKDLRVIFELLLVEAPDTWDSKVNILSVRDGYWGCGGSECDDVKRVLSSLQEAWQTF